MTDKQPPPTQDIADKETIGLLVHSYNNFLAGMMGFTELSLMEVEQEDVREKLELVLTSGKEARNFGKQLLSMISRIQIIPKPVDLIEVVQSVAKESNSQVIVSDNNKKLMVDSDTQWLWQCLHALSQFCIAINSNAQLQWKINEPKSEMVEIQLHSVGLDLDNESKEKLFEPFYTSRKMLGAKGVGLAFVKGFFVQMKGEIEWVQNDDYFRMSLPKSLNYESVNKGL